MPMKHLYRGILLISMWLLAVSALADGDPAELRARLHQVEQANNIDDPSLNPWHLQLSVQLYDAKGKPGETGTIEEWWAGAKKYRIVYASPSYSATEVRNENGWFRTPGMGAAPYLYERLLTEVTHPIPDASDIEHAIPDLRKITLGKADLDCIMLDEQIKNVAYPPLGLFPTYCAGRNQDVLRVSYEYGSELTARNTIGKFQGRHVPIDPSITVGNIKAASGHVDVLSGMEEAEGKFDGIDGLEQAGHALARISGSVIAGNLLNKVQPQYPDAAKKRHVTGTVLLHAIIGTDGHVHSLRLISVPDPDLAIAAIAAVRQWTYKPYSLNGVPTSVDTTIAVNFNMN